MIAALKEALQYYTANFGPFQNRQIRIAEFPYGDFAQSFPNTVPFSERLGFIYDDRVLKNFDYVGFVTAHEVAHQWWAHQVTPAGVPGAQLLSESLAEYSALMVMERRYGAATIRKYLERDLSAYLKGRGKGDDEKPLAAVRMEQGYIAYNKGALALYALKDEIGETVVNRALARFVREYAYKSDPYPSAADLIRLLREEAGPEHHQLIADLFEKITLWDLAVTASSATAMPDGKWRVSLVLRARKLEATGNGEETEVPMNNFVDIGLFASNPADRDFVSSDVILLQKRRVVSGVQTVELIVGRKPAFAGINPYNKLIERNTDDNILALQ
jgi:aminopeptidase N